ncbi:DUF4236 domain-containing protein [Curtobacterium sp. C1]|uniref:DUF4236 domain-containing protein n=1 Tax=Curtobacterium sp. C1 TaxID=2898151 RepID=UPI001E4F92D6|nr:DUF4236 domain-containing protein [Curtobacterium sp. C1]UFU14657.1 DUF4236 domain-containing protein [Curtobacterium sp. C1]
MGLILRARRRIAPGVTANLSKRGVSVSARRAGVTVNTRGRVTIRLGKGISFRL